MLSPCNVEILKIVNSDGSKDFVYVHPEDSTGTPLYSSSAYTAVSASVFTSPTLPTMLLGVHNGVATYGGRFLYRFYSDSPISPEGNTGLWELPYASGDKSAPNPCAQPPPSSPPKPPPQLPGYVFPSKPPPQPPSPPPLPNSPPPQQTLPRPPPFPPNPSPPPSVLLASNPFHVPKTHIMTLG